MFSYTLTDPAVSASVRTRPLTLGRAASPDAGRPGNLTKVSL